jgi:hypothetical protein
MPHEARVEKNREKWALIEGNSNQTPDLRARTLKEVLPPLNEP